jgi:predicted DNA binding CopG/RHH family protein
MKLTKSEREIQKAIQEGKFQEVPWSEAKKYGEWARAQAKNISISIRINGLDLENLKAIAAKKGKKYQTYIGEILHREAQKAA